MPRSLIGKRHIVVKRTILKRGKTWEKMNTVVKSNSFESFEEAFYQVPEFAKWLQVNVPITLEEDGTFSFFGEGQEVYEYRVLDEDLGWGS